MAMLSGTRFGPYEIVAPLGEGGTACAERGLRPQLRRVSSAVAAKRLWRDLVEVQLKHLLGEDGPKPSRRPRP